MIKMKCKKCGKECYALKLKKCNSCRREEGFNKRYQDQLDYLNKKGIPYKELGERTLLINRFYYKDYHWTSIGQFYIDGYLKYTCNGVEDLIERFLKNSYRKEDRIFVSKYN